MSKLSYKEKLLDPRWQKLRLQVLERDDFSCRFCCSNVHTLHVHHIKYKKGAQPWEYPLDNFLTLCDNCHERYHSIEKWMKEEGHKLIKIISTSFNIIAIYEQDGLGKMVAIYNRKGEYNLFFAHELIDLVSAF